MGKSGTALFIQKEEQMRLPLKLIATSLAVLLWHLPVPAVAAAVPQSEAASPTVDQLGTNVRIGTVLSINPTRMILSCRHKGKTAQLDLVLNGVTVQKGAISVG